MNEYGFLSLIPPVLAIFLAIRTKQVIFSLIVGILVGWIIISDGNVFLGLLATVESFVDVFKSSGNTRTIIFTLLIGALIQLIRYAGGVDGFVRFIQKKLDGSKNPKRNIQLAAGLTGFLIFVESNISILTVGSAFKPLFDKYQIAKEKLAYLADSSSAPSCILFPLNAWGAYVMGLLMSYEHLDPFKTLVYAIPFNFYPILTLGLVFFLAYTGKSFGPMKEFENQAEAVEPETMSEKSEEGKAWYMIVPLLVMVLSMPVFLIYTGWDSSRSGDMLSQIWISIGEGSGSSSVTYAVLSALIVAAAIFGIKKIITIDSFFKESVKGMNDMLVMAILMVLAFALGSLCKTLETGPYVAEVTSSWLSPGLAPFVLFITSCFVAFSTGTSWGTFAIMISIAVPLAQAVGLNPYLSIAAVLGGGVFGDHCSPISDTTLIASVASRSNHIDHVRTQLPYALFTGSIAAIMYIVIGYLMA
ncbi:MAG: sodium:solute symporter [Cyclobacteriaceae bacterium]